MSEPKFEIGDRVIYTDNSAPKGSDRAKPRSGIIIEISNKDRRVMIKWDKQRLRTWIRFSELKPE